MTCSHIVRDLRQLSGKSMQPEIVGLGFESHLGSVVMCDPFFLDNKNIALYRGVARKDMGTPLKILTPPSSLINSFTPDKNECHTFFINQPFICIGSELFLHLFLCLKGK